MNEDLGPYLGPYLGQDLGQDLDEDRDKDLDKNPKGLEEEIEMRMGAAPLPG